MILKNGFQQQQQDNKGTFVHPHKLSRLISIRNRTISIYNCKHTSYSLSLCSSLTYTTGYLRRKTCHGGCCACVNVHFVLFVFINLFLKSCCGQLLINVQNQCQAGFLNQADSSLVQVVCKVIFKQVDTSDFCVIPSNAITTAFASFRLFAIKGEKPKLDFKRYQLYCCYTHYLDNIYVLLFAICLHVNRNHMLLGRKQQLNYFEFIANTNNFKKLMKQPSERKSLLRHITTRDKMIDFENLCIGPRKPSILTVKLEDEKNRNDTLYGVMFTELMKTGGSVDT
uniref:Uncharacterized protein n=1 Tax=Glossina palpalis gambiensis TaxID=67801 RepID=A0A1B0BGY4_9MUSC